MDSHTYQFDVKMTCSGCSGAINRVLTKAQRDGIVSSFDVNLEKQEVNVKGPAAYETVLDIIKKTGKEITLRLTMDTVDASTDVVAGIPSETITAHLSNPTTPNFTDDFEWIEAYLTIHVASHPSRRYSYILWVLIGLVFFIVAFLHLSGASTGVIGVRWNKWALRRRTLRKKHARMVAWREGRTPTPYSLPPNGQILALTGVLLTSLVLCFVGPDYIFPDAKVTQFRRELVTATGEPFNISSFFPFQPQYSIQKAWWTSANRAGTIAFALFPLCILFGIKQAPFALFANAFTLQFHFDKLVWLHRWTGRFIWFITTLHVAFWSVQLVLDRRDNGHVAYQYVWLHRNFVFGWIAFGFLTSIILFSLPPIRTKYYETFYLLHVLLVPLALIMSALHHPPIAWWCWTALIIWVGERIWRLGRWVYINGFTWSTPAVPLKKPPLPTQELPPSNREEWEMGNLHSRESSYDSKRSHKRDSSLYKSLVPYARVSYAPPPGFAHAQVISGRTIRLTFTSPGYFSWAPGQHFIITVPYISKFTSHPFTCASICDQKAPGDSGRVIVLLIRAKGGFTKDLWNTVVSLSTQYKTHAPTEKPPADAELPKNGVLLRMFVDGPFGSSARARWGSHSTVVIVAGGSGVSFGLAVLEYVCLCIAGRDGEQLGGRSSGWGRRGFLTTRVRFVWLVREFAHIQWCATALRRCLNLVPAPGLQVDIFVTNFKTLEHERKNPVSQLPRPTTPSGIPYSPPSTPYSPPASPYPPPSKADSEALVAPSPFFSRRGRDSPNSVMSLQSANSSVESFVDLNPVTLTYGDEDPHTLDVEAHENHTLELTNFEGDDDAALPGEDALSRKVRKAGKIMREKTRKAKKALAAKEERERTAQVEGHRLAFESHSRRASRDILAVPTRPISGRFDADSTVLGSDIYQSKRSPSPLPPSPTPGHTRPLSYSDSADHGHDWDAEAGRNLISQAGQVSSDAMKLEVEDDEMEDVNVVSECARPGKPKLDRIFSDEIERSEGSVIVGCCGPSSLNAMVRKSIALHLDASRLQHGDMRGLISLVSEEFAY